MSTAVPKTPPPDNAVLTERQPGWLRVTLNRPTKLNSLTAPMLETLLRIFMQDAAADDVRAVLLTGNGRAFCAGQDLSDRAVAPAQTTDLGASLADRYNPLITAIADLPKPVIAAVNGVAAGAGANIALACDIVLAARSASFMQAFSRIGLMPDSGGTYFLPRLVGHGRATALAMLAETLPAETAADWGMIWRVVDDDALTKEAEALTARLAAGATGAYARIKHALRQSPLHSLSQQLQLEQQLQRELGESEDYREGVAAFLEKRAARFSGK